MVQLFWKKLTILNIGLLIIALRLYSALISLISKYKQRSSLFPSEDENGFPFQEQIMCNMQQLFIIANSVGNISINENMFDYYNNLNNNKSYVFDFNAMRSICNGDMFCYNLNTNNEELNETHIWDSLFKMNLIDNKENVFYYKIISGLYAFSNLNKYKDNYNEISNKVAFSHEYVNNLFYLHSLLIKSILNLNGNHKKNINATLLKQLNQSNVISYINQCISINNIHINHIQDDLIRKFNQIENILLNLQRNEMMSNIKAIKTIIKIFFNINITVDEYNDFDYFLQKFIKGMFNFVSAENEIQKNAMKYKEYEKLIMTAFISIGMVLFVFVNKYFIKHKEFYSHKGRYVKLKKTYEMNKMKKYQDNLNKIKQKEQENQWKSQGIPLSQLTPEEREYVEKLTGSESSKGNDFIITK